MVRKLLPLIWHPIRRNCTPIRLFPGRLIRTVEQEIQLFMDSSKCSVQPSVGIPTVNSGRTLVTLLLAPASYNINE